MKKRITVVILTVAVLALVWWWPQVRNEIFLIVGSRDEAGAWYGTWSGFGGALPDVLIVTAFAGWYWHMTCHAPRCLLLGKHPAAGGLFKFCRYHHPDLGDGKLTLDAMHRLHREHQARTGASP
jgi:hypothetical protein